MNRHTLIVSTLLCFSLYTYAGIDMQAHVASDEGRQSYAAYESKQSAYYTDDAAYDQLMSLSGDDLFGVLNALMGRTCLIGQGRFTYNSLRDQYKYVDKDLNTSGNIIGYYDGRSMSGVWDQGSTWNREHTWPQSKGANSGIPMGHDMQSVRPTSTAVNSDRGNAAYGEGAKYYDPNVVSINNTEYKAVNMGSYRGDAARVILYDYVVYGEAGGHQNSLYNGNAQLPDEKLGTGGVFESLAILLRWHMQDPPSLTEMVRNDGAQNYQGNRNPFIDYPELAVLMLRTERNVTTYGVTYTGDVSVSPRYTLTTAGGFVCYLTDTEGHHPEAGMVTVTGGTAQYDATMGRLIVTNVQGAVTVTTPSDDQETGTEALYGDGAVTVYTNMGVPVCRTTEGALHATLRDLPAGLYIIQTREQTFKILY
ncbi:MAG: endonuclease [Paludibacteraceae bacterium]|nr:endonuclease [Paludibacteraceae bacterium]